jgi:hypothetical protein
MDLKFYFCESCGKRLTNIDLEDGQARDKKLKGVYCKSCSVGVMTKDMPSIGEEDLARSTPSNHPPSVTTPRKPQTKIVPARHAEPAGRRTPSSNQTTGILIGAAAALVIVTFGVIALTRPSPKEVSLTNQPALPPTHAPVVTPVAPATPAPAPPQSVPAEPKTEDAPKTETAPPATAETKPPESHDKQLLHQEGDFTVTLTKYNGSVAEPKIEAADSANCFRAGAREHSDRGMKWATVPPELDGQTRLFTALSDKGIAPTDSKYVVNVSSACSIYLLLDPRLKGRKLHWMDDSWTDSGLTCRDNLPGDWKIWKKEIAAAGNVTLGCGTNKDFCGPGYVFVPKSK